MKKSIISYAFLLLATCVFSLSGCSKNLDNIPSLSLVKQYGEDWTQKKLEGYTRNNIMEIWGEPSNTLSGMNGDIWNIDDDYDYIVVYYNDKDKISEIKYVSVLKATILDVTENDILVEPCENEWELKSADKITVGTMDISKDITSAFKKGVIVLIAYNGIITETYPAQIVAEYGIEISK
ncbi:MAG: hypothetical protein ACERKN_09180 [Velocimicrobium sp.]